MNPYHRYVSELARLVSEGRRFPLGGFPALPRPTVPANAPRALIFSPHPDDECIIGALALRLMREAGMRVVIVAVTQGSIKARQAARLDELRAACEYLVFHLAPWMQDNVRRGGELVGGQGAAAPDFMFCTLYRLRRCSDGQVQTTYAGGRRLPASVNAGTLLA